MLFEMRSVFVSAVLHFGMIKWHFVMNKCSLVDFH